MPITYRIDSVGKRILTTVAGPVTVDDIVSHIGDIHRLRPEAYPALVDTREVTGPFLSASDIWRAASLTRVFREQGDFPPCAIVAENELIYGLVRMFENLVSDFVNLKVFRDVEAAEKWLANPIRDEEMNPAG